MNRARSSITSVCLALLVTACGSGTTSSSGTGGSGNSGSGGSQNGGSTGSQNGGSTGSDNGGSTGSQNGGSTGTQKGGSTGSQNGGSTGTQNGGSTGTQNGGSTTNPGGGAGGKASGGATAGATGAGGVQGGATGSGGSTTGGGGATTPSTALVTSTNGTWTTSGTWTEATSGTADVTVSDTTAQNWEGFGGCFNEMGWNQLSTSALQTEALGLLFGTDGAHFTMGRIPIGASDYAMSRYSLDDPASDNDPAASSSGSNRPAADTAMANFKIDRDTQKLIPYVQAALAVNPNLRLWASPWTPPPWMKTGYKTDDGSGGTAKKPSYYDGGSMVAGTSNANLTAYAQYYTKWVQAYKDKNINIEMVSPQNEPGYDQNYPSCLWDKATYVSWINILGPAMKALNVKVMLGTLSNAGDNSRNDLDIATAVMADSTAKNIVTVAGVQWGVLDKVNGGTTIGGLPIWATEHKCGNYPWNPSGVPKYVASAAPNDQAYGLESWGYIRDAINKGKVTAYNAWNMVLDNVGKGIDTSRDWAQDSLLTVSGGKITKTQAYYVFRHFSQFVDAGATVVKTSGSADSVAFKNPDGSLVAVVYSSAAKSNYMVAIGGKKLQFSIPAGGWATVKYKP